MKLIKKYKKLSAIALAMGVAMSVNVNSAVLRDAPELSSIWQKLDAAKTYREDFHSGTISISKDYDTILADYLSAGSVTSFPGQSPQQLFEEVITSFRGFLSDIDPAVAEEALLGLQEAQNEFISGQSLVGNDSLINGLRVRYPGSEPPDNSQTFYLSESVNHFKTAVNSVINDLRNNPQGFRTKGVVNPQFPFFVENTTATPGAQGEVVESEYFRLTDAINRMSEAGNSLGKRLFFFGNVKDEDNYPQGNFPGQEDLDLDNNGVINAAGRETAAQQLKRTAQATYLNSILLSAVQTPGDFDLNNGYKLKRQVLDANRAFGDILAGFNPLQLLGDFTPFQPVENFLGLCGDAINDAATDEGAAKLAGRSYDQDQTQLATELRNQQLTFLNSIEGATGIVNAELSYNLLEPSERELLFADAKVNAEQGLGTLGSQLLNILASQIEAKRALEQVRQIPEKIRIEEERNGQISDLLLSNGRKFSSLAYAEAIASGLSITVGYASGSPGGPFASASWNPSSAIIADKRKSRELLQAAQQATIGNINSGAMIKQLLLDQIMAMIAVERAINNSNQQIVIYNEQLAELQRTVRGYVAAQQDLATAYFANPAYRLERDIAANTADKSFETAMEHCYVAAKALEYNWSEDFNNPVSRLDGLLPEPLPPSSDPFVRAESVFSSKFARGTQPNLDDFRDSLREWDVKMRQLRSPNAQTASSVISLRKDILGYNLGDEALNRLLFADFIKQNRVDGVNPTNDDLLFEFGVQIADQNLFPNHPNIKIDQISVNLVSSANLGSVYGPGSTAEAANIELVMLDQATVRTFFADATTGDDDLLIYDLQEGRTLNKSPFLASIDATVDGFSFPAPIPNVQLANHSPAVSRWTLRMQMDRGNNQQLKLENLDDIVITFNYRLGKPGLIAF